MACTPELSRELLNISGGVLSVLSCRITYRATGVDALRSHDARIEGIWEQLATDGIILVLC